MLSSERERSVGVATPSLGSSPPGVTSGPLTAQAQAQALHHQGHDHFAYGSPPGQDQEEMWRKVADPNGHQTPSIGTPHNSPATLHVALQAQAGSPEMQRAHTIVINAKSQTELDMDFPKHMASLLEPESRVVQEVQRISNATIAIQKLAKAVRLTLTGQFSEVHHCSVLLQLRLCPSDMNESALVDTLKREQLESITVVVPMEHVGRVIGKQGSTIRHLQEWTGARIHLPRESTPGTDDRVVTISGHPEAVAQCHALLVAKITPVSDGGNAGPGHAFTMPLHDPNGFRVRVPDELVGRVIGKKGSHIRQMQNESGATIFLPKECLPGTREREVILSGSKEQVALCLQLLQAKVWGPEQEQQQVAVGNGGHAVIPPGAVAAAAAAATGAMAAGVHLPNGTWMYGAPQVTFAPAAYQGMPMPFDPSMYPGIMMQPPHMMVHPHLQAQQLQQFQQLQPQQPVAQVQSPPPQPQPQPHVSQFSPEFNGMAGPPPGLAPPHQQMQTTQAPNSPPSERVQEQPAAAGPGTPPQVSQVSMFVTPDQWHYLMQYVAPQVIRPGVYFPVNQLPDGHLELIVEGPPQPVRDILTHFQQALRPQ